MTDTDILCVYILGASMAAPVMMGIILGVILSTPRQ